MRAHAANLDAQLSAAQARCEETRRSLAAAEGQLTSTKLTATQATMAAQVTRLGVDGCAMVPRDKSCIYSR